MNIKSPTFFIGYDSKEDIAYRVCKQSLLRRSSIKIKILSLKLQELVSKKYADEMSSCRFCKKHVKSNPTFSQQNLFVNISCICG